uniref:Uncharacterized protein n=1 Tax=Lepeophtheirus salmonis TaxID=72036 RepID=A0A0K2VC84_LEPSM
MRALVLLTIIGSVLANPKYPDICGLENKPSVDSKIIGGQELFKLLFLPRGVCTSYKLK